MSGMTMDEYKAAAAAIPPCTDHCETSACPATVQRYELLVQLFASNRAPLPSRVRDYILIQLEIERSLLRANIAGLN